MKNININGHDIISENCYDSVKVNGQAFCTSSFKASNIKVSGQLNSQYDINCDKVVINGSITANDLSVGYLTLNGDIVCRSLSGDTIVLNITGKSNVGEIKCNKLIICDKSINAPNNHIVELKVTKLDCNEIFAEKLICEEVKCADFTGLNGTVINTLYYRNSKDIKDNVVIKQIIKV